MAKTSALGGATAIVMAALKGSDQTLVEALVDDNGSDFLFARDAASLALNQKSVARFSPMSYFLYDMSKATPELTPKHIRAARALLAWSQQDLAKAADVATSTVADFERGQRTPVANNAQAMRRALEQAGIRFLPTGAIIGPEIRAPEPHGRPGTPIRWVNADDLAVWAERVDGALSLPRLLAHLIRASLGPSAGLRFPSDAGVRYEGWDGLTSTDEGSAYVPAGAAGWEISAQRGNIAQKATEDYRKRSDAPAPLDAAASSYICVILRHWPKKHEWVSARQEEGVWHEVRAYDADDLVHWIEQTPAVGLWLATHLGKRPEGIRELDEMWQEWSLATEQPLTADLVLSDRDEDAAEVWRWLRGRPSVLSLQESSAEEVVAFYYAALGMLPDDVAAGYLARSLVATTAAGARALMSAQAPLYIVLTEPEPGLARLLTERGHYVLQAYDDRPISRGDVRRLARPSREGIAAALIAAGMAEARARGLARDSARNLVVLRRLIPGAPGRVPWWVEEPPNALLAALLAGGWDEDAESDRARLAEIAGEPYEAFVAALTPYFGDGDYPLRKIGPTWRVASPSDAWYLLAPRLTADKVRRFEAVAGAVLGLPDPRFEMDQAARSVAAFSGVRPEYSEALRHGLGQVLILLALWGERIRTVADGPRRAEAVVRTLLHNATGHRWWSLSRDFRLLAEAAPSAFLGAIEDSLDKNDPPIRALFGIEGGGLFETEHISDLLWALESLAWSPGLMPRVAHVLARLHALDTLPGRYANRPINSLREINLLWNPQTYATLAQRLKALDQIRKTEGDAAWALMLGILPAGHDSSSPTAAPRWRDFSADEAELVTWELIGRGAEALTARLLDDVGASAARWRSLLDRFADLAPDQAGGFARLEAAELAMTDEADREAVWTKLRQVLSHHRQFPEAEWSMPEAVLDRLGTFHERFAPLDPLKRTTWLFEPSVALPNPSSAGWEVWGEEVEAARRRAAAEHYAQGGAARVLALARMVETPGLIGKALYESGLADADLEALLAQALTSDHAQERQVGRGLIICAFAERKEPWAAALIARARSEGWSTEAILTILGAFPAERWTWDQAALMGPEIEQTYWKRSAIYRIVGDDADAAFAVRKLIDAGRARHAVHLAGLSKKNFLPSDLLVEVLREALRQPFEGSGDANEMTMIQHHVTEILQRLDERPDVDQDTLGMLEWNYLALLSRSRRPAKALLRALAERPALFIEMVSAVFRASEDSGIVEPPPADPEQARAVANQAYRLLDHWNRLPGTREDDTIDGARLEAWIREARALARTVGREDIADSRIGHVLSASPMGSDGNWPAEEVRDAIDLFRSMPMIEGFRSGKFNRRGVTTRASGAGGDLERGEAAKYRAWAQAVSLDHPHTGRALDMLADFYERDAVRHDEDAERRDWID